VEYVWTGSAFVQSDDELDILEALIESNRQRIKDNEQVGKEADALMGIEKERAKRRQAENAKETTAKRTNSENGTKVKPVTLSEHPMSEAWEADQKRKEQKAKTRDTVGEKVGVSGLTAERSAFCV
jgi:hypothetical protein